MAGQIERLSLSGENGTTGAADPAWCGSSLRNSGLEGSLDFEADFADLDREHLVAHIQFGDVCLERPFRLPGGAQDRDRAAIAPRTVDLPSERCLHGGYLDHPLCVDTDQLRVEGLLSVRSAIIARPKASRSWAVTAREQPLLPPAAVDRSAASTPSITWRCTAQESGAARTRA